MPRQKSHVYLSDAHKQRAQRARKAASKLLSDQQTWFMRLDDQARTAYRYLCAIDESAPKIWWDIYSVSGMGLTNLLLEKLCNALAWASDSESQSADSPYWFPEIPKTNIVPPIATPEPKIDHDMAWLDDPAQDAGSDGDSESRISENRKAPGDHLLLETEREELARTGRLDWKDW